MSINMPEKYRKLPGSTDVGKDYEHLNIARLILKLVTDTKIDDFAISLSNNDVFGFDDIVVETTSGNTKMNYCLQLKHSTNKKALTIEALTKETGDFSIKKYFELFKENPNFANSKLILFTNKKLELDHSKDILFKNEGFSVTVSKIQPDLLLNTSQTSCCYKFENLQGNSDSTLLQTEKNYQTFFNNFFLYTNQSNVVQIKTRTTRKFQKEFCCSGSECVEYLHFISEWSKRNGQDVDKLDKNLMTNVIAMCLMSSYIKPFSFGSVVTNKMKLMQKAIKKFDVAVFEEGSYAELRKMWGNAKNDLKTKLKEANEIRKTYQLDLPYIQSVDDLSDKDCTKLLWIMKKCPIIVDENDSTLKAIQLCRGQTIILLTRDTAKRVLKNVSVFQCLSDMNTKSDLFKKIITTFKCSIQGKKEVSLNNLFQKNERLLEIVTTSDLLQMIDKTLPIGGKKEVLPEPYVSRSFLNNVVEFKYIKSIQEQNYTIIVISCIKIISKIKDFLPNDTLINVRDYLKSKNVEKRYTFYENPVESSFVQEVYVSDSECTREEFEAICKNNSAVKNCHHFRLTNNDNLEWLYSKGDISVIQMYRKVDKHFTDEEKFYKNTHEDKINVVTGEPGIGKSALMRSLKNNSGSNLFTVFLNFQEMELLCNDLSGRDYDKNKLEECILNILITRDNACAKSLDLKVIKLLLKQNQIIYMWDGLNEISSNDMEVITDIIIQLSKENLVQWVTSRSHHRTDLERKFNVLSKQIAYFNDNDQKVYFNERLQNDFQKRIEAQMLPIIRQNILGNPLHICMLTDMLMRNQNEALKMLENAFNVTDLFRYFVDAKFNKGYEEKLNLPIQKHGAKHQNMLKREKDYYLKGYQNAALKILVPAIYTESQEFLHEIEQDGYRFGIIIKVSSDGVPHFLHKTFAEYFVASYFSENFHRIPNLHTIMFQKRNTRIRYFFDFLLAKDSPAHVAVLYKNLNILQKHGNELRKCKDLGGRSVLHVAAAWGQTYPRFKIKFDSNTYSILDSETGFPPISPEVPEYSEMLHYLVDKCDSTETDQVFNFTAASYADESDCLFSKIVILQKEKKRFFKLNDDTSLASVVLYSAVFGYDNVVDMFEEFPFMEVESTGTTLLHIAASHPKYMERLLGFNNYKQAVNNVDKCGGTPLYHACVLRCEKTVQHLINSRADPNVRENLIGTPLHAACITGDVKIAEILLAASANIEARTQNGFTPLHFAVYNECNPIVRLLIQHGADVNSANKDWPSLNDVRSSGLENIFQHIAQLNEVNVNDTRQKGATALHMACIKGNTSIVRMLITKNADIHAQDVLGFTPILCACMKDHVQVVEMLIKQEPSIKDKAVRLLTPLTIACGTRSHNVARFLIDKGANVNGGNECLRPLHAACLAADESMIKLLIKFKACINAPDVEGCTALHIASLQGFANIVQLLIRYKPNLNAIEIDNWTPLHAACQKGHAVVIRLLAKAKAKLNVVTNDGSTLLHIACLNGHYKLVSLLINECKAKVNAKKQDGFTPLQEASKNGHDETVKELKKFGAA